MFRMIFNNIKMQQYFIACVILRIFIVGKRHILVNENMWMKEIAVILSNEFKSQGENYVQYMITYTEYEYFYTFGIKIAAFYTESSYFCKLIKLINMYLYTCSS